MNLFRKHPIEAEQARTLHDLEQAQFHFEEKTMALFDDLSNQVTSITNAAQAQMVVLAAIKSQLDGMLANSNLDPADAAQLAALSQALANESTAIVNATVANTPAAAQSLATPSGSQPPVGATNAGADPGVSADATNPATPTS